MSNFNVPTPIQRWTFYSAGNTYNLLIKRDDLFDSTSSSGNKIRKLEFILPPILQSGYDLILSLGPEQSNSCAVLTTTASKFGLKSAHVLIKTPASSKKQGNMFFHKLFGSKLFHVSRDDYLQKGQEALLQEAKHRLISTRFCSNPFIVPMGGSTICGLFGYIECFHELELQLQSMKQSVDEIFFACGSGGTAAGLAIGKYLTKSSSPLKKVQLTGYIVWDSNAAHFHKYVNDMLKLLGFNEKNVKSEQLIRFIEAKGIGYGVNSDYELELIKDIAKSSGVILDGTYTAKAVLEFIRRQDARNAAEEAAGHTKTKRKNCLFLHTGGMYSMFGNETFP